MKNLSPEIVSLIHHVELNESGWWKKAVGQVVKGVLWKAEIPQTLIELQVALKREVGIELTDEILRKQLDVLSSQQSVTILAGSRFKLTERERNDLTESQKKAISEKEECEEAFQTSCRTHCPELEAAAVWEVFQRTLAHAIQVTGANLFHLLADGNLEREVDWVARFLNRYAPDQHEGLRRVLSVFFAPSNHACRNQVLRLMSAHFFAEASQLRPETLAAIEGTRSRRTIKVVLDTNFIFSVLQLHDNPGDDSALSLVDLAQRAAKSLEIKLYVLPGTLEEAKRTLAYQMNLVERVRTTQAMARAAVRQPLPSIARKFFAAASLSSGLTASSFFQPYIDDLRTILRSKGIEVLDAHPAIYNQRQDVVDDVLEEIEREEKEVPESKRKGYETHLHDAVLWHAVEDRRSALADSPFDVEYWAVSIDWRLIAFDRRKRAAGASNLPIVLHPSNLVQLVQFWVPRTAELEASLVDSLRLPLFFQSFDPEDERATVQVLQALSRYENIGDLTEETVSSVLANRALRGRLKDSDASNDQVFALVREELLSEHKAALSSLELAKGYLSKTEASLQAERKSAEQSALALKASSDQLLAAREKAEAAERRAAEAEQSREAHAEKLLVKEREVADAHASLIRLRFVLCAVVIPAIVGIGLGLWTGYSIEKFSTTIGRVPVWAAAMSVGLLPMALTCVASSIFIRRHAALQDWRFAQALELLGKKAIAAPALLALGAIFQGGIWDWVKAASGWTP
ncbi:hypothetical protein ACSFBM_15500 [Variovorax sp. GB1R11]|uniref:hypothetical protein n=1 Tax=Variovorax sp. GB1R11 TaxID=3443741 RepID=UPI003F44DEA4